MYVPICVYDPLHTLHIPDPSSVPVSEVVVALRPSPPSPRPAERLCKRLENLVLPTAWEGPILLLFRATGEVLLFSSTPG